MQRHVMKYCLNTFMPQIIDQLVACDGVVEENVKEMKVIFTTLGYTRQAQQTSLFKRTEIAAIKVVNRATAFGNHVLRFQLGQQECAANLARQIRRSDIDPGVFVHFSTNEFAPISPLLADDLSPFDELRPINNQCAAFPANIILGLVKTVRAEVAYRAKCQPIVKSVDPLRRIFDND